MKTATNLDVQTPEPGSVATRRSLPARAGRPVAIGTEWLGLVGGINGALYRLACGGLRPD